VIVDAIALLSIHLFLTALRLEKVALVARIDMLQMSFFLASSMFHEYRVFADQSQCPLEIGNANDDMTLLITEALIRHLNTLLAIIWLLRDTPDLALDRVSTHFVENFFDLFRRIIHDDNPFNQMLKATANLHLMNEGIEILSKEGDSDVRRIPTGMNMAGVKAREAQMEEDFSWLTIRIEDPKAMAVVCLRACRHSTDIDQTNRLKFNKFSQYTD
jgi:hypothetical protein